MSSNKVTCSFVMDRDVYNAYKSIINRNGESVKGNLVRYMQSVIQYGTPNAETILATQEAQALKKDPDKRIDGSFSDIFEKIDE